MRVLSRRDVVSLLSMPSCIDSMRSAFQALAGKTVQAPQRTVIRMQDRLGFLGSMPVYAPGYGSAAKVMTIYPENHDLGIESHQGHILLFGEELGDPLALIEAGSITGLRTAAVSGLATDILAGRDASTLCILGSGVQARTHTMAIRSVREINRIRVWSRTCEHAETFGQWVEAETGILPSLCVTAEEAVNGANVICTVTASTEPIVQAEWLKQGCHINAVGSFTPSSRELSTETVKRSKLFVDSRASASVEAGDILIPKQAGAITDDHILAELGELITDRAEGRTHPNDITVFKSLGLAIEDLVAAKAVYDRAVSEDVGILVG
jgi:alanine dehydrogenase